MSISEATDCSERSSLTKAAHVLGKYLTFISSGFVSLNFINGRNIVLFVWQINWQRRSCWENHRENRERPSHWMDDCLWWSCLYFGRNHCWFFLNKKKVPFLSIYITLWTHYSGGSRISQTDGDTKPWDWRKNLLFGKIFVEDCMKMKEIVPRLTFINPTTFTPKTRRPSRTRKKILLSFLSLSNYVFKILFTPGIWGCSFCGMSKEIQKPVTWTLSFQATPPPFFHWLINCKKQFHLH